MEFEEKKLRKRKEKAFNEGNKEQIAEACSSLGDFLNQCGRYIDARIEYEEEALIYQKLGPNFALKMAKANRMIGEMYMLLCEFDNALHHINIYLKHAQNLNNKIEEQRAYATLGRAYLLHGQNSEVTSLAVKQLNNAEKAFIKSLLIVKDLSGQISKLEILDMQARLYLNIGVVKEHMEDFEQAIEYKEKAIKICKSNDIFELLHLCYISLSLLYELKKSDSTLALRFCNLALEVAERLPEKTKKICETLFIKADMLIKQGDFQSAKKVLTKAYKMKTPNLNDRENIIKNLKIVAALCYTLNSLSKTSLDNYCTRKTLYEKMGDGCCLLQNYSKAIEYYLQTLDCAEKKGDSEKQLIPIYISLYQTYKDNNDFEKCLEYLWKEYEANKDVPVEAISTLCNIGEICEIQKKSFWTVYDIYQNALKESKKINEVNKMQKIVFIRLFKLALKYSMTSIADDIKEEALKENIDVEKLNIDDDIDSEEILVDENTPDIGEDICLDDLTDSNSESEECDKSRTTRRRSGVSLTIKRNNKGETQLHQACIAGNLMLASRLIDQGHAVNVRDHAGWLPLHEACNHGFKDIVELLLDKGALSAINDKGGTKCDGITPLYDACSNGYLDVAEFLLERGANSTIKTDFGDTPLNVLDKWRNSVDLDYDEQTQYERIRSKMVYKLNKIGEKNVSSPVTNLTKTIKTSDKCKHSSFNENDSDSESVNGLNYEERNSITRSGQVEHNFENENSPESLYSKNLLRENHQKPNAKFEYKSAIESLKHPNRVVSILPETIGILAQKKRGAFLDDDEVDDNWLDDDLGSRKKKYKPNTDDKIHSTDPFTSKKSQKGSTSRHSGEYYTLPTPRNYHKQDSDSSDNESLDRINAFSVLFDSKGKTSKSKTKMRRRLSINSNSSRKSESNQSNLFEKGFCRFLGDNSSLNDESNDRIIEVEPDSTTVVYESPRKDLTVVKISPPQINQTVSFKIKVENELLLVPVERKKINELKIKWLAEETSKRYYNLIGLKPILRLMTADGFGFEETDFISVALDENMISSKVLEWKISPLAERYEEMCNQLNQVSDDNTKSTLEKSQISNILSFSDWSLTSNLTEPIFRALLHQSTLRVLDLSNNFIQNDGCKQLGKSLITLKQLKILNLQGNCITSEGLGYLIKPQLTSTTNEIQFPELKTLNLSFNPLGNKCLETLQFICKISNKLNKLYLESCGITNFYEYDLNFQNLIDLNISYNNLNIDSINKIFNNLNTITLERISMNFINTKYSDFGLKFYQFLEKNTNENLKQIEISGCNLTDSDIYKIVKLLKKSLNLELIDLSNNNKLTGLSFKYIMENLSHVHKIILDECENILEISKLENLNINDNDKPSPNFISMHLKQSDLTDDENLQIKNNYLQKFWCDFHGEKGKIYNRDNFVCLYVNENDLY